MKKNLKAVEVVVAVKNPADRRKVLLKKGSWVEGEMMADGSAVVERRYEVYEGGGYVSKVEVITIPAASIGRVTDGRGCTAGIHGPLGECYVCAYEKLMSM